MKMDISNILNDSFKNRCFSFFKKPYFLSFIIFVDSSLIKQYLLSEMMEKRQSA